MNPTSLQAPTMRSLLPGLISLLLAGCQGPPTVFGSGVVDFETRTVGPFRTIEVRGPFVVNANPPSRAGGDSPNFWVRADVNLIPLIETALDGDRLIIRFTEGTTVGFSRALEVVGTTPTLEGISLSEGAFAYVEATAVSEFPASATGRSRLTVLGASSSNLVVKATDHSEVTIRGAATRADIEGSDSSWIDLKGMPLESATLNLSGSSRLDAEVTTALSGRVSGGSQVNITGKPANTVALSGTSSLTFR